MHPVLRRVVDHRSETSLATQFRRKRFEFFMDQISILSLPVKILDVGGEQVFWERMGLAGLVDHQITILNIISPAITFPNFHGAVGDATNLAGFSDQEFDLVFSNSVIEHLGTFQSQQRMAGEVLRVGRCYFVQTPNRFFPLEPHFLVPFFQFFPKGLRIAMIRRFDLGWYQRTPDLQQARQLICTHRLLSESELRRLFPNGELYKEKIFGLTKSFSIYRIMAG